MGIVFEPFVKPAGATPAQVYSSTIMTTVEGQPLTWVLFVTMLAMVLPFQSVAQQTQQCQPDLTGLPSLRYGQPNPSLTGRCHLYEMVGKCARPADDRFIVATVRSNCRFVLSAYPFLGQRYKIVDDSGSVLSVFEVSPGSTASPGSGPTCYIHQVPDLAYKHDCLVSDTTTGMSVVTSSDKAAPRTTVPPTTAARTEMPLNGQQSTAEPSASSPLSDTSHGTLSTGNVTEPQRSGSGIGQKTVLIIVVCVLIVVVIIVILLLVRAYRLNSKRAGGEDSDLEKNDHELKRREVHSTIKPDSPKPLRSLSTTLSGDPSTEGDDRSADSVDRPASSARNIGDNSSRAPCGDQAQAEIISSTGGASFQPQGGEPEGKPNVVGPSYELPSADFR